MTGGGRYGYTDVVGVSLALYHVIVLMPIATT